MAEKYVGAFGELAKSSTTVLLPANTGDVGAMVAQAMAVYGKMSPGLRLSPRRQSWPRRLTGVRSTSTSTEEDSDECIDVNEPSS